MQMLTTDLIMKSILLQAIVSEAQSHYRQNKHYTKVGDNPYGILQSKTFGAPVVSGDIKPPILKDIVKHEIVGAGAAGGLAIGGTMDAGIGFSDAGLLFALGSDIGNLYRYVQQMNRI